MEERKKREDAMEALLDIMIEGTGDVKFKVLKLMNKHNSKVQEVLDNNLTNEKKLNMLLEHLNQSIEYMDNLGKMEVQ